MSLYVIGVIRISYFCGGRFVIYVYIYRYVYVFLEGTYGWGALWIIVCFFLGNPSNPLVILRFRKTPRKTPRKTRQVAWGIVGSLLPSPPWPNFHASFKTTSLPRIRALAAIIRVKLPVLNWETFERENPRKQLQICRDVSWIFESLWISYLFSCKKTTAKWFVVFFAAKHATDH